jgi:two-component system sensor histidine kinase MprB
MSLRIRLALALALLVAASVVAVTATNYLQTSDRLRDDVDAQLRSDSRPLLPAADPDGVILTQLCLELAAQEGAIQGYAASVSDALNTSLQCIDAGGTVTGHTGSVNLPVTGADRRLEPSKPVLNTRRFRGDEYRTVTIPGVDGGTVRIIRSLGPTEATLASIRNRSALIGLGVILFAALMGWLIAQRTTRPMERLTSAAEDVAVTGRLDHPVPSDAHGEVGRLARAFTTMLRALDQSHAQQQRLVQDASHELRTPLTSLRTNLDTLRRHAELDPAVRERVLADLDSELRELGDLATELVQLTVDAHPSEPELPISLDELVLRVATRTARRTGRDIRVDSSPTTVTARPEALTRAIGNLLDNACKFSPEGTPIEVEVRAGCIEVRDHGPGIDIHDLPFVFDRFFRAVDARGLPGSGLGLSIARTIVEGSGGRIYAENDPGGGARISIVLPTTEEAAAETPLPSRAHTS